jgi:peptide deformylase
MFKIVTYPNPILDQQAEAVTFPLNQSTTELIDGMWEVVKKLGVGLAAPQVGVSKQICLVHLSKSEKGKNSKDIVMINPNIIFKSELESEMIEGCLSFPEEYWKIWRPTNVVVEYQNIKGKKQTLRAGGWLARVVLHEVDHLNGKIFTKMGGTKIENKDLQNEDEIID